MLHKSIFPEEGGGWNCLALVHRNKDIFFLKSGSSLLFVFLWKNFNHWTDLKTAKEWLIIQLMDFFLASTGIGYVTFAWWGQIIEANHFASGYLNTEVAGARVANEHLLWDKGWILRRGNTSTLACAAGAAQALRAPAINQSITCINHLQRDPGWQPSSRQMWWSTVSS